MTLRVESAPVTQCERKPSGPLLIQNRQSDGIAFDGVVGVMMINLKIFRIGNQAKSPLSGQPLKLEDLPSSHKDTDAPLVATSQTLSNQNLILCNMI